MLNYEKHPKYNEWIEQNQDNECFEYQCDNESGLIGWSICNGTEQMNKTCVDGKCIENKKQNEDKWGIIIEMDDNMKAIDLNITEFIIDIITISGINNTIDIDEIIKTTEIQIDENGDIMNIVIYVEEEETANIICNIMKRKSEEGCEQIICLTKNIRIKKVRIDVLSTGHHNKIEFIYMMMIMIFIMIIIS